ncbi:hypothetical protein ACS0TY_014770 [Phlomoides rotata]
MLLVLSDYFVRINSESINGSSPNRGACGFFNDVGKLPYNGFTAAGNNNLYKSGNGCGTCYQVRCTNSFCSGRPVTITITNECPGACNKEAFHFDLSGKAFGALAKTGQSDKLRNFGIIDIQYQRVPCNCRTGITVKIDAGSNPFSLAIVIENVNGDGNVGTWKCSDINSKFQGLDLLVPTKAKTLAPRAPTTLPDGLRGGINHGDSAAP